MRPRIELYLASLFLLGALCFSKYALIEQALAGVSPSPSSAASPYVVDPVSSTDPKPDKAWGKPLDPGGRPVVQIAILLDTSSSMDGLIDQARTQLWRIVNEFGRSERRGRKPQVQVALYEYGKSTLAAEGGYLRQVAPFTTDLDGLSEALFSLRTNGGDEYCGWVLRDALRNLAWRPAADGDLRIMFVAGNEPFTQGPIDYRAVCRDAVEKGIIVNTVFCGESHEGAETGWANGAALGGGRYLAIDQNQQQVYVPAPQDDEIRRLNDQLNQTYLPYGNGGQRRYERQMAQDSAVAGASSEAYIQRASAKANSAVYSNESWDLCDAVKQGTSLSGVADEALPPAVRALPASERPAFVARKAAEREAIQRRITALTAARERYVATRSQGGDRSLQNAVLGVVHAQGKTKGYTFQQP